MKKIKTIFERDWEGNRKVIDKWAIDPSVLDDAIATEKLDGTNIRVTVRNHTVVRVEKRRNPDKIQKHKGIEEPWYVDASDSSEDKWIMDAVKNTSFSEVPDGEWSGEALGRDVQGNPLNLTDNRVVLFSLGFAPILSDAPTAYEELKVWLPTRKSEYGNNATIEGIVWHCDNGDMYKIKAKDF